MAKRIHTLTAKPGQLRAGWGRPEPGETPDLCYAWGAAGADKTDGRVLSSAFEFEKNCFGRTLREELEYRGYDVTTLKFSIEQKTDVTPATNAPL
ncbi:hypothetical protein [Phaeobacter inhibens]|uniref:hypothetical protein n=1 Tax=Phaeobacter inhibens TaxID=221822 RepID=UPI000C9AB752|nr:hypothetical protein [Phaeobacter inhibens]AUQ62149.1 hypothetical protein PhaeoP51_01151 [Phaeobacter inhibens]AUQ89860.1 hypothetical protein PhaeoP24_01232 [Phaeobacter inhibens]